MDGAGEGEEGEEKDVDGQVGAVLVQAVLERADVEGAV